jgi:2-keto-4-pentenoate hydratase
MTVDLALLQHAAAVLREAEHSRQACPPLRHLVGSDDDVEAGYAIQQLNHDLHAAAGRRITGRKIGLTSPAVQAQLGVGQPDFGTLYSDMEFGDGVPLPNDRLLQPRAEAEVALVLEHDLDSTPHGFAQIVRATAFVLPSVEVVDSRIADWNIRFLDTVADNASSGLYVVGGRPVPLRKVDLRSVPMTMTINDVEVSSGVGSNCLGHPLHAARWLADMMCRRGTPLRAGDVVMTGALGPMRPIAPGDEVVADFGDLGQVTTRMEPRMEPLEGGS